MKDIVPIIKRRITADLNLEISKTCFTAVVVTEVTFAVVVFLSKATTPRPRGD